MILNKWVKWGNANPKRLFIIDGLGAIVSAFFLGIVLVKLDKFFGIPTSALYFLAALPCLFAIYDFFSYIKSGNNIGLFLKGIAITNLLYCCLSIGLAIYHIDVITYLAWLYIIIEVMIVSTIAFIELRVATSQINQSLDNK
jgi:hypothetical protein